MAFNPLKKETTKKIKGLSMYQPYAWMVANGYTEVDDRTWFTPYRGKLAIHASKKIDMNYYNYLKQIISLDIPEPEALEYGGIIAVCDLTDCIDIQTQESIDPSKHAHGGTLAYGFVMLNTVKTPFIPYRGMAGLFDITSEELNKFLGKS